MNLIIDIGNTCVKLIAFDGEDVVEDTRADEDWEDKLRAFCARHDFTKAIYSTVRGLGENVARLLDELRIPSIEFVSGKTLIPIQNNYRTPETLGADRLAAVVGANYLSPGRDILIVDVGTCVTFDFVSAAGVYEGGNISPGPTMRLKALHEHTARLPLVERKGETPFLGYSTQTAIRSGVAQGLRYEIEGYVRAFLEKYPRLLVYLTGGVRLDLHFSEKIPIFANDFIVPIGLNRILEYNDELP